MTASTRALLVSVEGAGSSGRAGGKAAAQPAAADSAAAASTGELPR
ncbi:MAG TPA: hypothetical protein VJQ80_15215 [Arthrobacter sp.]|nr:hypothetical protein [Arthrobacter sp.]